MPSGWTASVVTACDCKNGSVNEQIACVYVPLVIGGINTPCAPRNRCVCNASGSNAPELVSGSA